MNMKRWRRFALVPLAVVAVATVGFIAWAETPLGPMPEATSALESGDGVAVETEPWLTFTPENGAPVAGLIVYPGGRVDPRSYAPLARRIASEGYLVVIPPMPLNLAVLAPHRAADVVAAHPEIEQWALAGHSLGGAMAARFAFDTPDLLSGLVLWAAYPAESNSLAGYELPVLSIYGTQDMGLEGIEASRDLLPVQTQWVVIDGGNHAQFGSYGEQPGDGQAEISRAEQQDRIAEETLDFVGSL